ncbi:MAG: zinc-ribbon domain-containing protein [Candidatus Rokubacteria bacterium]|nr:zinc-ribbon domain-containing protein [Candidatus Rokubacteria bacterium]
MSRPLSDTHRRFAAQWHRTKNGALFPHQVTAGSGRPVWWRCRRGPDHEWQASPASRTSGTQPGGCPFCSGRRLSVTNSLATRFPEVAAEWHPTRNGRLRPPDVVARARRSVWWKCPEGSDHEWSAPIYNRTNRVGCPYCAGKRVSVTNSLASRFPAVAREWHPTKNGRLTPRRITAGSGQAVWWRCRHDARHIWLANPNARTRAFPGGCPFCWRGRAAGSVIRSFAAFPRLALHWHPTRNGPRTLDQLARRADQRAWWRCPSNPAEAWEAALATWFQPRGGCSFCHRSSAPPARSLAFRHRALAAEWHPTKNGTLTAQDVSAQSGKKVWWRCRRRPTHVWAAVIAGRVRAARDSTSRGCPFCASRRRSSDNSLAARAAAIAAQWHSTRNGRLRPEHVGVSSKQRVWWRCRRGPDHVWSATVLSRTHRGHSSGCPFCVRHQVSVTNSLARLAPTIAAQWHPTKNGALTPDRVDAHSEQRVWWRCSAGPDHVWATLVRNRTKREHPTGCPCCANRQLSVTNSLAARFPALAGQWHPTRNGALGPDQVMAGSHRKAWWRCPRNPDHEWRAQLGARTGRRQVGCPECWALRRSSGPRRRAPRELPAPSDAQPTSQPRTVRLGRAKSAPVRPTK